MDKYSRLILSTAGILAAENARASVTLTFLGTKAEREDNSRVSESSHLLGSHTKQFLFKSSVLKLGNCWTSTQVHAETGILFKKLPDVTI